MNFANELLVIAENVPKVYEAGKKAGGGGCNVDHTALRQEGYNEGYNKGYTEGETVGYSNGYTEGQNNVQNPFEYATALLFREVVFPDEYELSVNVPNLKVLNYCFYGTSGIKKITIKGNTSGNAIDFAMAFRNSADLEIVDFTEFDAKVSTGNTAFHTARKLREILGELDFTECTVISNMFNNCYALEEIRIKANSLNLSISFAQSSLLSATSVQSIIDGLSDLTGADAQTLTLRSSIVLTDEQKAQISSKNWTLVQ